MRRFTWLLLTGVPSLLGAQGFGVYEHNTCTMGRGGVSAARPCADGSAIFFNPAGLGGLSGGHVSAGVTLIHAQGGFTDDLLARKTDLANPTIPVPNGYLSGQVTERIWLGFGVNVPFGLETDWDPGWMGRFHATKSKVEARTYTPTIALQLSDTLSVGGGASVLVGGMCETDFSGYPDCRNTKEIPKICSLEETEKPKAEEIQCEKCGKPMVLKRGRFGEFMACSGYPDCRNTKKIVRTAKESTIKHDIPLDEKCPVCGKNLAIKHGRYGEYTACSDYPNCKYIKLKSTGVACGKSGCSGEIVERNRVGEKCFMAVPITRIAIL